MIHTLTYFEGLGSTQDTNDIDVVKVNREDYLKPNFIDVDNWHNMGLFTDDPREIICINSHCYKEPSYVNYSSKDSVNIGRWIIKYKK